MTRILHMFLIAVLLLSGVGFAHAETFRVSQVIGSVDTTPPSIPTLVTATAVASTQIDITWTASTDNVAVTGYEIFRDTFFLATVTAPQVSYNDSGLIASTTYFYTVRAFDLALNYSTSSATTSATTLEEPAVVPTATSTTKYGSFVGLSENSLDIQAVPGIDRISLTLKAPTAFKYTIRYGTTYDATDGSIENPLYLKTHSTILFGLKSNTEYWVVVEASNAKGLVVVKRLKVVTQAAHRETLPTNPDFFTALSRENGIHLTWKNPKDEHFSEVRIVRNENAVATDPYDGVPIYEGRSEGYIDSDVRDGVVYGYTIFSRNRDGQFSSGAVVVARAYSKDTIGDANVVILPPGQHSTSSAWLLEELTIFQNGIPLQVVEGTLTLGADLPFTVSLNSEKVPKTLKTILVTLRDPKDFKKTFSFLLRINEDGTAYEARIGALTVAGTYETVISLLTVKTQTVESASFSLRAIGAENPVQEKTNTAYSQLYFYLLALAFVVIAIILFFLGRKKDQSTAQ